MLLKGVEQDSHIFPRQPIALLFHIYSTPVGLAMLIYAIYSVFEVP